MRKERKGMRKEVRTQRGWGVAFAVAFAILLLSLFALPIAAAVEFDLGEVNHPDPVIGVKFNEPVTIVTDSTSLYYLDKGQGVGLDYSPDADELSQEFNLTPSGGDLALGNYQITIVGLNNLGLPSVAGGVKFVVTGLTMRLRAPPSGANGNDVASGISDKTPYVAAIRTGILDQNGTFTPVDATCRYYLGSSPPTTYESYTREFITSAPVGEPIPGVNAGSLHETTNLEAETTTLSIMCREYTPTGAVARDSPTQYVVGYDLTAPVINVTLTPPSVENPNDPSTSILVQSDDEVYCTLSTEKDGEVVTEQFTSFGGADSSAYDEYKNMLGHLLRFDDETGVNRLVDDYEPHTFTYTITCTNLAGRTTTETLAIPVDLDAALSISVMEPPSQTNADPVTVEVSTNMPALCTVDGNTMQRNQGSTLHNLDMETEEFANYEIEVMCASGDKYDAVNISFLVDRNAPTDVKLNASELVCDNIVTARVRAKDDDTVRRYGWRLLEDDGTVISDGYSATGELSVEIPYSAGERTLHWEAFAEDRAGNTKDASPLTVTVSPAGSDECDTTPFIHYYEPPLGWWTEPFDLTIETKRPAMCRYSNDYAGITDDWTLHLPFDKESSDGLLHTILNFNEEEPWTYHFLCNETGLVDETGLIIGDGTIHSRSLTFGIEPPPPTITTFTVAPNPVIDYSNKFAIVNVTTDQETVCSLTENTTVTFDGEDTTIYDSYRTKHRHIIDYSYLSDFAQHQYQYLLLCKNRAGLSDDKQLPIVVNFIQDFTIEVLSPEEYTSNSDVTLLIKPQVQASCEYRPPDSIITTNYTTMTANNDGTYEENLGTLEEGPHTVQIRCTAPSGQTTLPYTFTVDSAPPTLTFNGTNVLCKNNVGRYTINLTDTVQASHTTVTLRRGNETTRTNLSGTSATYTIDSATLETGSYTLLAVGYDRAGNPTTPVTIDLNVYEADDDACTNIPIPTCNYACGADDYCEKECSKDSLCEDDPDCEGICLYDCVADDICESECDYSADCDVDPDCEEPAPDQCPYTCYENDICEEGCATDEDCDPDPDCAGLAGLNWLALILIIVGLLVIGGAGYYLYYTYQQRTQEETRTQQLAAARQRGPGGTAPPGGLAASSSRAGGAPPGQPRQARPGRPDPQRLMAGVQRRREEELEAFKRHASERQEKRHSAFDAFGEVPPTKTRAPSQQRPSPESRPEGTITQQQARPSSDTDVTADEFVPLDQLGKKREPQKRPATPQPAQKSPFPSTQTKKTEKKAVEEDSFDELDELIEEEK